jgi:hypothetical protein
MPGVDALPQHPEGRRQFEASASGAAGHKQTHAPQQTASSFDQLVGAGEQRRWDIEPERLGSLEVDDEVVFDRLLDG